MASSGSSGRTASRSRSFDFGSDDVLCSYDEYVTQDHSITKRADPKDLCESGIGRPLISIYEQEDYSKEGMMSIVEKCMKKYADNVLCSLEGISGRLSQLEIHCYKLERSLGEFRVDFSQNQGDNSARFKSLENHIDEVRKSVQILRDKQELAETQKELAKLQLQQKEAREKSGNQSVSDSKRLDDKADTTNLQLALALPRQATAPVGASQPAKPYKELPVPQQGNVAPTMQQDQLILNQAGRYYPQHQLLPQDQRSPPVQTELHYVKQTPQLHDIPVRGAHQQQQQPQLANQNQSPIFPQYQQQLPPQANQQLQQPVVQPELPTSQAQIRPQIMLSYPPYSSQPVNAVPETFPGSTPMQVLNLTVPQSGGLRPEVVSFGYVGAGSSVSQPLPHHTTHQTMQPLGHSSLGPQLNKGVYMVNATYPPTAYSLQGYNALHSNLPSNLPDSRNQQLPPSNITTVQRDSHLIRNHPYGEMIEKAVGMGYDRNQVISTAQRMVESGQPMDFNSLLDGLNGQASGVSARAW